LTREPSPNDFLPAILTIVGSIGAALAVSKREKMLRLENESLKNRLLLWRTLTAIAAAIAGWSWYYG